MIWNDRIRELRENSRFTLLEVSKILGVSEATAQRYESKNGIKNIPYEQIIKYAKIFQVSPSYIMGWDDKTDTTPLDLPAESLAIAKAYSQAPEEIKVAVSKLLDVKRDVLTEMEHRVSAS